jgi:hypothetical protein
MTQNSILSFRTEPSVVEESHISILKSHYLYLSEKLVFYRTKDIEDSNKAYTNHGLDTTLK